MRHSPGRSVFESEQNGIASRLTLTMADDEPVRLSLLRVTNRDGSTHVEEIVQWEPARRLRLHMSEFSPPVSRLATAFDETWRFEPDGDRTHIVRSIEMHPKSALTRPLLWLISLLLKWAIARHLEQMRQED